MALLKAGVDLSTISQWLGPRQPQHTNQCAAIDLDIKRKALARVEPLPGHRPLAWGNNHTILEWLEAL